MNERMNENETHDFLRVKRKVIWNIDFVNKDDN